RKDSPGEKLIACAVCRRANRSTGWRGSSLHHHAVCAGPRYYSDLFGEQNEQQLVGSRLWHACGSPHPGSGEYRRQSVPGIGCHTCPSPSVEARLRSSWVTPRVSARLIRCWTKSTS